MKRRKKLGKPYMISIGITIIISIIVMSYIIVLNSPKKDRLYMAEDGRLDLNLWEASSEGNIYLDGEWEFYPGVLLGSADIASHKYEDIKKYITVPGSWKGYLNEENSTDGAGTYRLLIKVPQDDVYGIKTRTIRSSGRIYFNGQELASLGYPTEDKKDFIRESKYRLVIGNSLNEEIELIIHIANFDYKIGGIVKSIEFGSFEGIMESHNKSRALEATVISICLTLSTYFLILYSQRRKEKYLIFFALMNFFMAIYLSTMNEQLLDLVYNYDYVTRTTIQIIATGLITISLLLFVHYFFNHKSIMRINKWTVITFVILSALSYRPGMPIYIYMRYLHGIFLGLIMFRYVHIFYILLKEIYNKSDSSEYILVIITSMFLYGFTMALKILMEIDLGNLNIILISILIFSGAALMNHRLQLDYQRANELSQRLIRQDDLKDEFLAKTSHELRTPLHLILNLTRNLLEGQKGTLNSTQQEDLFFVHQETQRLTRLVGDLLDASRIKKGEVRLRLGAIEPHEIVEELLNEMNILIPEHKDIVLKNKISQSSPQLKADPDKFRQIIYNLVHNAIKYTENGEIVVSSSIGNGQVEIKVSDMGIGIEEKYYKEVFDTFFQKDQCQQERGLGLGLSIVKYLVESQGGTIDVESVYGKGSTFKFTIPIYNEEVEDEFILSPEKVISSPISKPISPILKKENKGNINQPTILIVDDEPLNQKIILDTVRTLEFNTILADSGTEALEILENEKIDLIILDLMLPDISGDEVCKIIRQKFSIVELPILILTASGRIADLMNSFDYGVNDFQRKPLNTEELKSRIQSLLSMKETVEEGLQKEFQYFYSQISPHFLYNTINTIIGLSYNEPEKSRKALNYLSVYFRGKLDVYMNKGLIRLESELELIKAYLEIEKMRYGERLAIQYDIEEGLRATIPPLTIQPLVENAIKHGVISRNSGGIVKITARKEEGAIKIIVEDNGKGMDLEKKEELLSGNSERIGFNNVLEKLKRLKGVQLNIESKLGQGTKIEIIIPEVRYHEGNFS